MTNQLIQSIWYSIIVVNQITYDQIAQNKLNGGFKP